MDASTWWRKLPGRANRFAVPRAGFDVRVTGRVRSLSGMPSSEHMIVRQIEFVDTDMAGIMHFSNYYRMMEAAETSFFRSIGLPLFEECEGRLVGWPRVRSRCDYHAPLRFNDIVEVHLFVKEIRTQALNFFFRFRKRRPDGTREAVARGELTTVCATLDPVTQQILAVPLPQVVRERLEVASKSAYRA